MHTGAGAYICGEETALLDSLEGKRGQPRLKPPFPATNGLYDAPTVVNNVGTLASVPYIVLGGADWFKEMGPEGSPGPSMYSLSGRVTHPGQYEAPMGTHAARTARPGRRHEPRQGAQVLDAGRLVHADVHPGAPGYTARLRLGRQGRLDERHVGPDDLRRGRLRRARGARSGASSTCTSRAASARPCREGTYWYVGIYERLENGGGTKEDIDTLLDLSDNILGRAFCALGDGAVSPVTSSIKYFRDEYLAHIEGDGCPFPGARTLAGAH